MAQKINNSALKYLWILILGITFIMFPYKASLQENTVQITDLDSIYESKTHNQKIEYNLAVLIESYYSHGIDKAKEFALRKNIEMVDNLVQVVVEVEANNEAQNDLQSSVTLISKQIESIGGRIETTFRNLIQSQIPIQFLEYISQLSNVRFVRLPIKPILTQNILSEGVPKIGASQWQNMANYRSSNEVKVCVLDAGFKDYNYLLGKELPSTVITKSFRYDQNIYYHKHGTACAEIIYDVCPNAKFYLVNFNTDVEHHNAVNWIVSQDIDIISYSMGWYNIGAGDGTGPICEDVKRAYSNGILWINAAGNEAEDHWEGTFSDTDLDGWHNFSGIDEILEFWVPAYTIVSAYLNWDDWGMWNGTSYSGSNQDFDLYLYYFTGSTWIQVDKSLNWQGGWQWPVESISGWASTISTYWGIAIRKFKATRNVKFELFIEGNSSPIQYNVKSGSIAIPADSSYAITVGATDWRDDSYHSYSSQGPTNDGRIKPDFVAPSGVSTYSYGNYGFYGTSASAPLTAGAFALILDKTPYQLNQVLKIIENRVKDLGPTGKDNIYGLGRINLIK